MNRLQKSRLKVKRANSHIDALIQDSTPLSKDLYEITNGTGRSQVILLKPDGFYLAYRPKQPIVEHFEPIIGDAVNNLREAMDHWINAAIESTGKGSSSFHFPFAAKWKDLEPSGSYVAVKKSFPDLADFVLKQIKPCRDTNLELWATTSLSNENKHRNFLPTVNVVSVDNINARVGSNTVKNCTIGGNADGPISIIRSDIPISIEQNFSVAVEVTFAKGAVFENQPVIPTLLNMSQVVTQTLDALDKFIAPFIP